MLQGSDSQSEAHLPTPLSSLTVTWDSDSASYPGVGVLNVLWGALAHSRYHSGINYYSRICSMRRGRNETGVCLTCWREVRGRSDEGQEG